MQKIFPTVESAAVAIPSSASLIFTVSIPVMVSEKDLPTIVSTEARKFIPVPVSEVSLDWWVIPRREDYAPEGEESKMGTKTEVLVAAIHKAQALFGTRRAP